MTMKLEEGFLFQKNTNRRIKVPLGEFLAMSRKVIPLAKQCTLSVRKRSLFVSIKYEVSNTNLLVLMLLVTRALTTIENR